MNNIRLRFYFKSLIFTLLFFIACGFQTSFWPNIVSFLPPPQVWLILMVFIAIKWPAPFGIFFIYFLGYCLTNFSDIPLKMIWFSMLIVYAGILLIKNRIQLTGVFLFIIISLFSSSAFEISYYYFSDMLEVTPTTFMFSDRLIQILMNFIFAYPLYILFNKIDLFIFDENDWARTNKNNPNETSYE